jgi:hypothetical protein
MSELGSYIETKKTNHQKLAAILLLNQNCNLTDSTTSVLTTIWYSIRRGKLPKVARFHLKNISPWEVQQTKKKSAN